jgi:O-antigen/teichoic acid export membrane protein
VFFPAYSRVKSEGHERLREVFYSTRWAVDGLVMPALGGLTVLGPALIQILYDRRYGDAGWMLRILAVRVAISALSAPYQFCLFAVGQSRYGFFLNLARTIALLIAVPVGFKLGGIPGLVWGVTLSEVPALIVVYVGFAKEGLASPIRETRVPAFYLGGAALGYLVLLALRHFGWSV